MAELRPAYLQALELNIFKVYNGPLPLPKCKFCSLDISAELSTRYCKQHALLMVVLWDEENLYKSFCYVCNKSFAGDCCTDCLRASL